MMNVRAVRPTHLIALAVGVVTLALAGALLFTRTTHAANAKDFNPGRIIDDAVFYNDGSMTTAQIQTFLNSKNPSCDTNGTKPASDWGRSDITHATLASYIRNGTHGYSKDTAFHAPPYTCTKDYKQNTPQMEAASGLCSGLSAKSNRTAAQIIKDVSDACGVNPQVLLVLLQKEQSLITDTWPLNRQYQKATGFDCPDTAPCDPAFAGFFYQVYHAARQFKVYKAYPNNYNYVAGRTNRIYWHPDLSRCGSSQVYIENQATAALYVYTPYRPNQAALDNLYGTGNSCSSYGNRNFWRLFTDWFGSTRLSYIKLDEPRWMQLRNNTNKVNWPLNTLVSPVLEEGRQLYFPDKIHANGQWLLRTQNDSDKAHLYGIPLSDLEEIPIEPIQPTWMSMSIDRKKTDPVRNTTFETVPKMTLVKVVDRITVNGKLYYRTEHEHNKNRARFLPSDALEPFKLYDVLEPRMIQATKDVVKIDITTGQQVNVMPAGAYINISKRVTLDGILYVQSTADDGTNYVIPYDSFINFKGSIRFVGLDKPRHMKLAVDTYKYTLPAKEVFGPELSTGLQIYFSDKVNIDGVWYLRTKHNSINNNSLGIPLSDIIEVYETP